MKKDRAYEVVDMRQNPNYKLGVVGIIEHVPGGLEINTDRKGIFVDLSKDENDEILEIDNDTETVTFHLDEGLIVMTVLNQDNYIKRVAPFVDWVPEDFSDEGLNKYFYKKLRDF